MIGLVCVIKTKVFQSFTGYKNKPNDREDEKHTHIPKHRFPNEEIH